MPAKKKTAAPRAKIKVPDRLRTKRDVGDIQRAMWTVISRPLTSSNRMPRQWTDGRPTSAVAAKIAKPNDRLTSFERLEIYSRMYWFRVLDSIYDDCPGLRAVLGDRRFMKLAEAYMVKYPSRSFSLRNLPDRMAKFILEEPRYTKPHTALCHDISRFEWARVEVFDTASFPVFTADDLLDADPSRLKLNLQPYLQLLEMDYPVDDFFHAVRQRDELSRGEASNTPIVAGGGKRRSKRVTLPKRQHACVAVHRFEGTTYYKRLDPAAYRILAAIRSGKTLDRALAAGIPKEKNPREDWASNVQGWFKTWMELGWFCRR